MDSRNKSVYLSPSPLSPKFSSYRSLVGLLVFCLISLSGVIDAQSQKRSIPGHDTTAEKLTQDLIEQNQRSQVVLESQKADLIEKLQVTAESRGPTILKVDFGQPRGGVATRRTCKVSRKHAS